MARATSTEGSKVYVGMLLVTSLAMLIGILVMVLEGMEYDWVSKAPVTPSVQLPVDAPPKADGTAAVPVTPAPIVAVETPKPFTPPAVLPAVEPKPAPAVVAEAPKPAPAPQPEATPLTVTPSGPTPSPLIFPGR